MIRNFGVYKIYFSFLVRELFLELETGYLNNNFYGTNKFTLVYIPTW